MPANERQRSGERNRLDSSAGEQGFMPLESGNIPPISQEKMQLLDAWRGISEQIVAFNGKQGGGHLQNGVYRYTQETLVKLGLDKQGWEALPAQTGSTLDMIGGDVLLVNRRTGQMELIDASSRRLDPTTGAPLSSSESQKANVPLLREQGVIDALPRWFDLSGKVEFDQDSPEQSRRVKEFAEDFSHRIKELTRSDSHGPFNLRDFPLPSPTVSRDKEATSREIKAVVDWSQKNADLSWRSGERNLSANYREFGRVIETGALAFSSRVQSTSLTDAVGKLAERIILEDAAKAIYPVAKSGSESLPSIAHRQVSQEGTVVQVKPDGALVVSLRKSGNGQPEICSSPSVLGAFDNASKKLALAATRPEQHAELAKELPAHYRHMFEAGKLDMGKILQVVARFRNQFAAGGVGTERALLGHLVHRLVERKPDELRRLATGAGNQTTRGGDAVTREVDSKEAAPKLEQIGRKGDGSANDARFSDHLSPRELARLAELQSTLEGKGNLSPSEKETLRSLRQAQEELAKPGAKTPQLNSRLAAVRRVIGLEGVNKVAGPAMLAAVVLNLYRASASEVDEAQPTFGMGW